MKCKFKKKYKNKNDRNQSKGKNKQGTLIKDNKQNKNLEQHDNYSDRNIMRRGGAFLLLLQICIIFLYNNYSSLEIKYKEQKNI